MLIRPFDLRDLAVLIRYRKLGLFFDNTLVLTRGPMLVPAGALLSYFAPATGIYTFLNHENGRRQPLIGQVMHDTGSAFARLSFLAPASRLDSPALAPLLEHMISRIGSRGALHLLAEVDEKQLAFEALRRCSFAIYARQRVWQLTGDPLVQSLRTDWRSGSERDIIAIRSLFNDLVPGLVQQIEPLPAEEVPGIVYSEKGELQAYVEIKHGSRGIWIQPFIHPDTEDITPRLADLINSLPNRRSRPVYVCIRSYQSWLEPAIQDLGAKPGPLQAVMVKHLAVSKRAARLFTLRKIEGGQPEATAPIAQMEMTEYDTAKNY